MPNGVTYIGRDAFNNCTSIVSIVIPDSVTSIEGFAFSDCTSLTSVTFGTNSQLAFIDNYAFRNCSSLTSIIFNRTVDEWKAISKSNYWKYGIPATYVQCSDGKVNI